MNGSRLDEAFHSHTSHTRTMDAFSLSPRRSRHCFDAFYVAQMPDLITVDQLFANRLFLGASRRCIRTIDAVAYGERICTGKKYVCLVSVLVFT